MASSCGAAGNSFKLPSQHHHRLASIKLYCLMTEASNLIKPFICKLFAQNVIYSANASEYLRELFAPIFAFVLV